MNSEGFQRFTEELRERLLSPLPGVVSHLTLAPQSRRSFVSSEDISIPFSEAAVLALFFPSEKKGEPAELLLTVRPEGMSNHAGQVAFPGGRREEYESLEQTALRETEEEVGVEASSIMIAGSLTPLFVPPSNFMVHPFVGFISESPDLGVTSNEVARLFSVPVLGLIDPSAKRDGTRKIDTEIIEIPYLALGGEFVWGATAMILAELISTIAPLPVLNQTPS